MENAYSSFFYYFFFSFFNLNGALSSVEEKAKNKKKNKRRDNLFTAWICKFVCLDVGLFSSLRWSVFLSHFFFFFLLLSCNGASIFPIHGHMKAVRGCQRYQPMNFHGKYTVQSGDIPF